MVQDVISSPANERVLKPNTEVSNKTGKIAINRVFILSPRIPAANQQD
jgi:hypothetical protein